MLNIQLHRGFFGGQAQKKLFWGRASFQPAGELPCLLAKFLGKGMNSEEEHDQGE